MKPPALTKHATGQYFCKWGGKNHYLGTDRDKAETAYHESIRLWSEWRESRRRSRPLAVMQSPLLVDLAARFLDEKELERGWGTRQYYAKHLKRFLHAFGEFRADAIRPRHLAELKEQMFRYRKSAKTISHDMTAVRVLFNWAVALELVPVVSFKGIRNPPLGPPPDKSMSVKEIRKLMVKAGENLEPWLRLTYLALLRPSETVRIVNREGRFVEKGVFRLNRGKMDEITALPRHCVLSAEAFKWLERCKPVWSRLDSFSQAARDRLGKGNGPGRLRHSAASHLSKLGVDPASIELLLGHVPKRLAVTYYQPAWQHLRKIAARLTL